MLSNFFNIPLRLAYILADCCRVILTAMEGIIFSLFLNSDGSFSSLGFFFLISVAISFIFVAIKFIRSFVWGA